MSKIYSVATPTLVRFTQMKMTPFILKRFLSSIAFFTFNQGKVVA